MALPPPPKYRRFTEDQDSKHVAREQAKKAEARARAEKAMREWEAEQERNKRMVAAANRPTLTTGNDPYHIANVVFYTSDTNYTTG